MERGEEIDGCKGIQEGNKKIYFHQIGEIDFGGMQSLKPCAMMRNVQNAADRVLRVKNVISDDASSGIVFLRMLYGGGSAVAQIIGNGKGFSGKVVDR